MPALQWSLFERANIAENFEKLCIYLIHLFWEAVQGLSFMLNFRNEQKLINIDTWMSMLKPKSYGKELYGSGLRSLAVLQVMAYSYALELSPSLEFLANRLSALELSCLAPSQPVRLWDYII